MSDVLNIQSHKGMYKAFFCDDALLEIVTTYKKGNHYIIDKKVADLYKGQLREILASDSVLLVDAKEENKSLEKFPRYVEHLVKHGIRRDHLLIAIGGGITQDITCFLASSVLRGVEWKFVPTTLLSQADSCIGSKSSINCGGAKNILGTFTPPREILISINLLKTLEDIDVRSGVGEMLKVHVIDGQTSFDEISASYDEIFCQSAVMKKFIYRSLQIKKKYIEQDEFDQGIRNVFNYGHTFGHAIEAATYFGIPHGVAVTMGMDMANYISWKIGFGEQSHFVRMHCVLKKNYTGFEDIEINFDGFMSAIMKDKKNVGSKTVTMILVNQDGKLEKTIFPAEQEFINLCRAFFDDVRLS